MDILGFILALLIGVGVSVGLWIIVIEKGLDVYYHWQYRKRNGR